MAKQTEVAVHLGVSDRQVRNWHKQAGFPVPKGAGGYDIDKVRFWYIDYLKNSARNNEPKNEEDNFERRKIELGLEEKQLNIEIKRTNLYITQKKYAPIQVIELFCSRLASSLASHFDASLGRLKRTHPDIPIEFIETLKKELALARNELAEADVDLSEYLESDEDEREEGA